MKGLVLHRRFRMDDRQSEVEADQDYLSGCLFLLILIMLLSLRTDTDDEDKVMGEAEVNVTEQAEKEKTNKEQKGDEHAGDEQVVVPIATTNKEKLTLLQSTSSHYVSSNFGNQFINSPNASLICSILENVEAEINSLLDIQIQQDVPNIQQEPFHAVKVFTELEQAVKELKQADHSIAILASIRSQSHTEELKKELSEKRDYKDVVEESVQANVINKVKNHLPKYLPQEIKEELEKTPSSLGQSSFQELFDSITWSMLLDEANMKKGYKPDTVLKKRDCGDDKDEDPSSGSNQGKKTKKRRFNESESSKNTSTTKESSKGKSLAKTSKTGKSVTAEEPVEDLVFEKVSDDVEKTFDDKVDDADQPPHTAVDETQAGADPKIPKKDCLRILQSLKYLILIGTPSKPLMILQNSHGLRR
ncbi:hypothetical protein Tco_1040232 [Tanacetum coccineum]